MTSRFDALTGLAEGLGITTDELQASESVDRLAGTFEMPASTVSQLGADVLNVALEAFGPAISLTIGVGDLVDFSMVDGAYDVESLVSLGARASSTSGNYRVVLQLEKGTVASDIGRSVVGDALCFVFASELDLCLAASPKAIQETLWPDPEEPLTIFVLDSAVQFVGHRLRIIGDAAVEPDSGWSTGAQLPSLASLAEQRAAYVGWDSALENDLTPFHFVGECRDESSLLTTRVSSIATGLSVLHLADRARVVVRADGTEFTQAEFRGKEHVAYVPIDWSGPSLAVDFEHVQAMIDVVGWCYQGAFEESSGSGAAERLPFVQTRLAQLLESRDEDTRLASIARDMPAVAEGVKWQWRSFVEGRVADYLGQVRDLDEVVSTAVDRMTDNTAALVKRVTDTALAAVAALVGVFIGAALKDPFQVELFRAAMFAYAAYVTVFPMVLGIMAARGDVKTAQSALGSSISQLQQILGKDRVTEVVGTRVSDAKARFDRWCAFVGALYVAAVIAAMAAALYVPDLVIAPAVGTP